MVRTKDDGGSALERLREFGLRYPGAHTKSPWPGHLDLAVNDKTFAYMSIAGEPLKISCKLPRSSDAALGLPFTTPTAYGLGKSSWVTATFPDGTRVPVELLEEWIDESYRAQAPKRLSAKVPAHGAASTVSELVAEATPRTAKQAPRAAKQAPRAAKQAPRAAKQAPPARAKAGARPGTAKNAPRSAQGAARRRSTVKQAAAPSAAGASPHAASPRSGARGATPAARVSAPSRARGARPARAATTRAGKRASVSPRAAKRTPKK